MENREVGVNAFFVHRLGIGQGAAAQRNRLEFRTLHLGELGDADRRFSHRGLPIHAPLSRQEDVGVRKRLLYAQSVEHERDAGLQLRLEKRVKSKAETARRSRAGHLCTLDAKFPFRQSGESPDRRIHFLDDLRRRPLLRTVDMRAAQGAIERIRHVAGDVDAALLERRMNPRKVDAPHGGNIAARPSHSLSRRIEKACAERCEHAESAVVRRTAADADDEVTAAVIEGGEHEFAESVRRRAARVALAFGHERQSCRIRHFDDRRMRLGQEAETALDWLFQRTRDGKMHDLA